MNRAAFFFAVGCFVAALHFTDRVIAGFVQCEAAQTCPFETDIGGRP